MLSTDESFDFPGVYGVGLCDFLTRCRGSGPLPGPTLDAGVATKHLYSYCNVHNAIPSLMSDEKIQDWQTGQHALLFNGPELP